MNSFFLRKNGVTNTMIRNVLNTITIYSDDRPTNRTLSKTDVKYPVKATKSPNNSRRHFFTPYYRTDNYIAFVKHQKNGIHGSQWIMWCQLCLHITTTPDTWSENDDRHPVVITLITLFEALNLSKVVLVHSFVRETDFQTSTGMEFFFKPVISQTYIL